MLSILAELWRLRLVQTCVNRMRLRSTSERAFRVSEICSTGMKAGKLIGPTCYKFVIMIDYLLLLDGATASRQVSLLGTTMVHHVDKLHPRILK